MSPPTPSAKPDPFPPSVGGSRLSVKDDYDPERHRSYVGTDDDPDPAHGDNGANGESAHWTMGWGDAEA